MFGYKFVHKSYLENQAKTLLEFSNENHDLRKRVEELDSAYAANLQKTQTAIRGNMVTAMKSFDRLCNLWLQRTNKEKKLNPKESIQNTADIHQQLKDISQALTKLANF